MKLAGCYKDFKSSEDILTHLETSIDHLGIGLGGSQLRSNGTEYYLRVYDGSSDSRNISRTEALELIGKAIS